jgi:hypothetical protein
MNAIGFNDVSSLATLNYRMNVALANFCKKLTNNEAYDFLLSLQI